MEKDKKKEDISSMEQLEKYRQEMWGQLLSSWIEALKAEAKESESVDHPPHYKGKTLEAIDIIEDFGLSFNLGNALKYILRAGKKESESEDIQKAIWYLERERARKK